MRDAEPVEEHYGDAKGSVGFDVTSLTGSATFEAASSWEATYSSPGHIATFRIIFDAPDRFIPSPILWSLGKGKFVAVPGSDSTALIQELKKQLEAKTMPKHVRRLQELKFEYVILGRSHARDANSKVLWTTMKLFFGDDQGEVFLNLNPSQKKGEFCIKDSDYGDFVVKELAQVL